MNECKVFSDLGEAPSVSRRFGFGLVGQIDGQAGRPTGDGGFGYFIWYFTAQTFFFLVSQ